MEKSGEARHLVKLFKTIKNMKEIERGTPLIVCAANRHNKSGRIILGARHWDHQMRSQVLPDYDLALVGKKDHSLFLNWEEGFIDQKLNFLTREEAYVIAKENNQIRFRCGGDEGVLYSENLY